MARFYEVNVYISECEFNSGEREKLLMAVARADNKFGRVYAFISN